MRLVPVSNPVQALPRIFDSVEVEQRVRGAGGSVAPPATVAAELERSIARR